MINEIVKKIDTEIEELIEFRNKQNMKSQAKLNLIISGLKKAKKIVLSEMKPGKDINVATKTKGDVIRESNESLIAFCTNYSERPCEFCATQGDDNCENDCNVGLLAYLNQPQEDTNETN